MQMFWDDLFFSIYKFFGFGIVFATVFLIAWPEIEKKGLKKILKNNVIELRNDKKKRCIFAFAVVLFMILSRTLICRDIWKVPWSNPIGNWGIHTEDGNWNIEGVENIILFIPLSLLGCCIKSNQEVKSVLAKSTWYSFLFSSAIELCQLFGRLGTFQLSDIAQNTIGGLAGGMIYCLILKIKKL